MRKKTYRLQQSCPPLIDPKTLEKKDIQKKDGKELIQKYMSYYFDDFLIKTKNDWNYILPTELKELDKSNVFLLDVRKPEDYKSGHIKDSINIFWLTLMKQENLAKLPKDKEIILICYVGHTASQILVLLKLLGYKVRVLKFGMGKSPTKGVPVAGWLDYGYPIIIN